MIISTPGKISERIVFLGRRESSIYLLKGSLNGQNEYAILGGGMAHAAFDILEQIKALKINEEQIKNIFILHSHFDHCGAVPFLKKKFPWLNILASQKSKEYFANPKFISAVNSMNQMAFKKYNTQNTQELEFSEINVDRVLKEKDIITCGDLNIEIIDTPGHSPCSISLYCPEEQALFYSDAAGLRFEDNIFIAANSNFDLYQESLLKLAKYKPKICLAEHYGAIIGDEAQDFLEKSILSAQNTRELLEKTLLSNNKDVKKSLNDLLDKLLETVPNDFLPKEVLSVVIEQMLKYLASKI